MPEPPSVITVRNLRVEVSGHPIVRDLEFSIAQGEVLGLVGESGAGKTAVALAMLGYARRGSTITSGEVVFDTTDILAAPGSTLRRLLGRRISFVPQNPGAALNPSLVVGAQIADVLRAHSGQQETQDRVAELLGSVSLPDGIEFQRRYPHQLSGGQQQRIAIALALACKPELVILDEPTTGLDVTTQAQVLDLLEKLRSRLGMALLYVSHNLAVVSGIADRVAVMYGGSLVEIGPTATIFGEPRHPYTRMLIDAVPRLEGERGVPVSISSVAAGTGAYEPGCTFASRCPHHRPQCDLPQLIERVQPDHLICCGRWRELTGSPVAARARTTFDVDVATSEEQPLLRVQDVTAAYRVHRGDDVVAVDNVSFEMARGECLAIVGESGSGKSTLARCIVGLHPKWAGRIQFDGTALANQAARRSRELRRRIQIVFQNPDRSLNPQHTIAKIVSRPCRLLQDMDASQARQRTLELLEQVRLSTRQANAYPAELSGGERQRVAIARALAADGDFIVCDEITSALDVSVQASLLELLYSLREQYGLSLLFISHDLSVVRAVADRILVMQRGVFCENQRTDALFEHPAEAYTQALIDAAPRLQVLASAELADRLRSLDGA